MPRPLQPGVGQSGVKIVRKHVEGDGRRRGVDDVGVQDQKGERRRQEDETRYARQEVQHGVEVAEPLPQVEPLAKQGVVQAQDLHHAARPADALPYVGGETLGGQPRRQGNADIGGGVAKAV